MKVVFCFRYLIFIKNLINLHDKIKQKNILSKYLPLRVDLCSSPLSWPKGNEYYQFFVYLSKNLLFTHLYVCV